MKKIFVAFSLALLVLTGCSSVSAESFDLASIKIDAEQVLNKELKVPVDLGVTDGGQYRVQVALEGSSDKKTWKVLSEVKTLTLPTDTELTLNWAKSGLNNLRVSVWSEDADVKSAPLASSDTLAVTVFDLNDLYTQLEADYWAMSDAEDEYWNAIDTCYTLDGEKGNTTTFTKCFGSVKANMKTAVSKREDFIGALSGIETISKLDTLFDRYMSAHEDALTEARYILNNFCHDNATDYGFSDDLWACVNTLDNIADKSFDRYLAASDRASEIHDQITDFLKKYGVPDFIYEPTKEV